MAPAVALPHGQVSSATAWSIDDLALLDEAAFLTGGRSRSYGHIVVDEAQDLTPMQFRMIARRAPSGSVTILGDLAQATGPWTYARLERGPGAAPDGCSRRTTTSSRSGTEPPGRVLDFASRLLPVAAPGVTPTSSIRAGRTDPTVTRVEEDELARASAGRGTCPGPDHALVAVIAPDDLVKPRWPRWRAVRTTSASSSGTP